VAPEPEGTDPQLDAKRLRRRQIDHEATRVCVGCSGRRRRVIDDPITIPLTGHPLLPKAISILAVVCDDCGLVCFYSTQESSPSG
jgi:hypothetical protein